MSDRRTFLRTGLTAGAAASLPSIPGARAFGEPAASRPVDDRGAVLRALLARNLEKHPGASGQNHVSMALLSLAALGGTPEQMTALGEKMLAKQRPFPVNTGATVTPANWRDRLGDMAALSGFRTLFTDELARRGVAATLRAYLPRLLEGAGTAEFHCMIRTAYGVRFRDASEVAMGLAYWSARFAPLGSPPAFFGPAPEASADSSLRVIARAAVHNYVARGDIIALHGVTGTHAYRVLESYVPDPAGARRRFWQALGSYTGLRTASAPVPSPVSALPSWAEIAANATSRGDHNLKLTDSLREEFRQYADPVYQHAAAFRLKMI